MCVLSDKPVLIYDGECRFCRYWVDRWQSRMGDAVEFGPSQELGDRFPEIPEEEFARSVQFVDVLGHVHSGAEAVFELYQHAPRGRWLLRAYHQAPGVRGVSEGAYRLIAGHRNAAAAVNRLLWGLDYQTPSYFHGRWLFLRNMGLIFLVAFLSLQGQITGLIGQWGILPAAEYLEAAEAHYGSAGFRHLPTAYWFVEPSDASLREMCSLGIALGAFVALGVASPLLLIGAAIAYLSLVNIGQDFLSFQWDVLLIEAGILAALYAPLQGFPRISGEREPSRAVRWLLWLLIFKLMFMSGVVKLDDPTWMELRALDFHYQTQPLPTVLAWYAHQLPGGVQSVCVALTFVIEIGVPFLIFAPRRLRHAGAVILILFQGTIAATGNYTFFNWLTIALCLLLFDDQFYRSLMPAQMRDRLAPGEFREPIARPVRRVYAMVLVVLIALSGTVMARRLAPEIPVPSFVTSAYQGVSPFRVVNGYGLFAQMTTSRYEIEMQGSHDGETWQTYDFRWKPGELDRAPGFVAPLQPRLDWQMWFAALSDRASRPWFANFSARLLQGSVPVERLLAVPFDEVPFYEVPPRYVRAVRWEYRFTDGATRRATGAWWERMPAGLYMPVVELPEQ